ncbi:reverse transcriptase domain-containing protein [Tanacetum coccineum]
MDEEPMWSADRVVAPTQCSAITIPETVTNFLLKGYENEAVPPNDVSHNHLLEEKQKTWVGPKSNKRKLSKRVAKKSSRLPTQSKTFVKLSSTDSLTRKSGRPSDLVRANTKLNPRGNNSKAYQPPQSHNEHVNIVFTRSADLGASINLMPYSLYAKLSLETLKPTKISVRLTERSFQYPIRIAKNMLVEVGKFIFPADFVILKMGEDSKVPLILGRPFLHTADAVIRLKQKQLNLGVGNERMIFNIDSAIKHSYSNDDTCFSIDVIDEILEEEVDALLDEGSKILHSIKEPFSKKKYFLNSINS